MRAIFEREISDGMMTFRLWHSAGTPDLDYPRAENDKYILCVEVNGYLLPLGMTDFDLINRCGCEKAVTELYGSNKKRGEYFDDLRRTEGDAGIEAALEAENAEIVRYGSDPSRQTDYIFRELDKHVDTYLKSREAGGKTFPDFIGAAIIGDLDGCVALSAVYKAYRQEAQAIRAAEEAEKENAFCAEQNNAAEYEVSYATQVIRHGGVLQNVSITFYRSKYCYNSYSVVNYLMRQYGVSVPLRTQGWINDKLSSVTIRDGRCIELRYLRANRERGSQKFFDCMNDLIRAVTAQQKGEKTA